VNRAGDAVFPLEKREYSKKPGKGNLQKTNEKAPEAGGKKGRAGSRGKKRLGGLGEKNGGKNCVSTRPGGGTGSRFTGG